MFMVFRYMILCMVGFFCSGFRGGLFVGCFVCWILVWCWVWCGSGWVCCLFWSGRLCICGLVVWSLLVVVCCSLLVDLGWLWCVCDCGWFWFLWCIGWYWVLVVLVGCWCGVGWFLVLVVGSGLCGCVVVWVGVLLLLVVLGFFWSVMNWCCGRKVGFGLFWLDLFVSCVVVLFRCSLGLVCRVWRVVWWCCLFLLFGCCSCWILWCWCCWVCLLGRILLCVWVLVGLYWVVFWWCVLNVGWVIVCLVCLGCYFSLVCRIVGCYSVLCNRNWFVGVVGGLGWLGCCFGWFVFCFSVWSWCVVVCCYLW